MELEKERERRRRWGEGREMLLADTQGLPSRTANPSPHTLSFSLCFSLSLHLSPSLRSTAFSPLMQPGLPPFICLQRKLSKLHHCGLPLIRAKSATCTHTTHHSWQISVLTLPLCLFCLTIWQTVYCNGRSQRRVKRFYWLYCFKPWVGSPCCWRGLISFHSCAFQRRRCSCLGRKGCSLWVNTFHIKVLDSFYAFFPHSFLGLPFHLNLFNSPLLSLWPLLSPSRCPAPSPQMYWIEWKAIVEMMPLIVKGVRMKKKGGLRVSSSVLGVAMTLMKPPALLLIHLLSLLTHRCSRPLSQPPPAPRAPLGSLTPALS